MYFIAEVSSNHAQDLERCIDFVKASADAGCDAVKFQLFEVEKLFSPEVLEANPDVLERKKWEMPRSFLPFLFRKLTPVMGSIIFLIWSKIPIDWNILCVCPSKWTALGISQISFFGSTTITLKPFAANIFAAVAPTGP